MSRQLGFKGSPVLISHVGAQCLRAIAAKPAIQAIKRRGYERMGLEPGVRVLDIGCGPGTDTVPMAQIVGPTGRVVGIDYDPVMIAEADREAVRAGVRGWTTHQLAHATALPFPSAYFDACYSERLFEHLPWPQPAHTLAEAARAMRPGGWIVVADIDWGTLSIATDEVSLERRIVQSHAARFANGYAGRQLLRLFRWQGLRGVSTEQFAFSVDYGWLVLLLAWSEQVALLGGAISAPELHRWRASLAAAHADGTFYAHLTIVLAAGRRPV